MRPKEHKSFESQEGPLHRENRRKLKAERHKQKWQLLSNVYRKKRWGHGNELTENLGKIWKWGFGV